MEILRLKDLGINPIKLDSKYGNKDIDNILHRANYLIYFFNTLFITDTAKLYLLDQIESLGKELNNVCQSMAQVSSSRKDELRNKLIDVYKKLMHYSAPNENDVNVISIVERMNKMLVAQYLKDKNTGLSEEKIIEWLRKIHMFNRAYDVIDSLKSVNNELLHYFKV